MSLRGRFLAVLLCLLATSGAAQEDAAGEAPEGPRCAAGGTVCIAEETYAADVCTAIEAAAASEGLDVGFLARLLWRESLFDAAAVSPAGAEGIAQFMPGTAQLRGLADPFNPAEAILASAGYLKELERRYGNLGLAAAAYNAGEERVERFIAGASGLPWETRAYVLAITGHPAEVWRDGPLPSPDYQLDPDRPFREACEARAEGGGIPPAGAPEPQLRPWGVILAAQVSRDAAQRQADRIVAALGTLVGSERIDLSRGRVPGVPTLRHIAQIGRDTRAEAEALCGGIRAAGEACMVLKN